MENDLKLLVDSSEKILYEGRPNKRCFIFESIFNPLLPIAIVWAIFDFGFIGGMSMAGDHVGNFAFFMIPFFAFHLMPVWIYLAGVLLCAKRYKNTYYIVTDRGIYTSSGIISKKFNTKPFAELSHIDLHRGFFDQQFGVGDIICTSSQSNGESTSAVKIESIENYQDVYNIVKKLQQDIYTDVMYPNDLRPKENHGYNTEYKG